MDYLSDELATVHGTDEDQQLGRNRSASYNPEFCSYLGPNQRAEMPTTTRRAKSSAELHNESITVIPETQVTVSPAPTAGELVTANAVKRGGTEGLKHIG